MPFETSDKLYHFGGYAVLAFLVLCGWELTLGRLEPKHFFAVWLAGTCYGIVDELLQQPVGRTCDANDWLADELGVLCGLGFYLIVRRLWVGREPNASAESSGGTGGHGGQ
jgi:VanZ family protein